MNQEYRKHCFARIARQIIFRNFVIQNYLNEVPGDVFDKLYIKPALLDHATGKSTPTPTTTDCQHADDTVRRRAGAAGLK